MPRRKESETVQVGLRIKEPLRAALEETAKHRGVSMNAEIVARLEQSFAAERRLADVFGSSEMFGLMKALAAVMQTAGGSAKRLSDGTKVADGWMDHPYGYDQAVRAACHALELLRPPGDVQLPKSAGPEMDRMLGSLGPQFTDAMFGQRPSRAAQVIEDLGPLAKRLRPKGDK